MEVKRVISVEIPEPLYHRLEVALQVTGQPMDKLMLQMLSDYTDNFMEKAAKMFSSKEQSLNNMFESRRDNQMSGRRGPITMAMTETAYRNAVKVYRKEISRTDGKVLINEESGMSLGSAQDYITIFLAMMKGQVYQRAMANSATVYYLKKIHDDFGNESFKKALSATRQHIRYYNGLGGGQLVKKEELVNELEEELGK